MAHTLFNVFPGTVSVLDNQTAMAVQSLLQSQATSATEVNSSGPLVESVINANLDEDDIFQCGKCKMQFRSLIVFVNHKREPCTLMNNPVSSAPTQLSVDTGSMHHSLSMACSTSPSIRQQQVSTTYTSLSTASLPQVVLNEADLLSLTNLEPQTLTIPVHSTSPTASYLTTIPVSQSPLSDVRSTMIPIQNNNSMSFSSMNNSTVFTMATLRPKSMLAGNVDRVKAEEEEEGELHQNLCNGADEIKMENCANGNLSRGQSNDEGSVAYNIITRLTGNTEGDDCDEGIIIDIDGEQANMTDARGDEDTPAAKSRKRGKKHLSKKVDGMPKKAKMLQCTYCSKGFTKNFDLQQHLRSHTGEKPFQCIVCGRAFAQKSNVKKHMQTHKVWPEGVASTLPKLQMQQPVDAQGECHEQDLTAGQLSAVELEDISTVNESVARDANEKENAEKPNDGEINAETLYIDNMFVCQYCSQSFKTHYMLRTHLKEHKNRQVYKCVLKTCGQVFHEMDSFLEHTKTHETEISYRCHVCNKLFGSLYDLGVHQYSHSILKEEMHKPTSATFYHCTRCASKYSTPEALERHMASSSHDYRCLLCTKVFTSERSLRRHMPNHNSPGAHTCPVCSKTFKLAPNLKIHMMIHSGEKPFECHLCQATFNRKDKLKRHMLIHEPIKRFKCPMRTHTGCTKEFNRPDKLKAHILTHTGVRPWKCRICNREFSRRPNHLRHQKKCKSVPEFICSTCGSGFSDEGKLREHSCADQAFVPGKRKLRSNRLTKGKGQSKRPGRKLPSKSREARSEALTTDQPAEVQEPAYCREEPTDPAACSARDEFVVVKMEAMAADANNVVEETELSGCETDLGMEPLIALNRLALNISECCYAPSNLL